MERIIAGLMADVRIVPIQPPNQVKFVTKLDGGGSLRIELNSGATFTVSPEDEDIQAFVVYTMLNTETRVLS